MLRARIPLLLSVATLLLVGLAVVRWPFGSAEAGGVGATNAIKALSGCSANELPANDDGSTGSVALPFAANFFGTTYSSLFVNNNGNVTFDAPLSTFTPFGLVGTETVIIAPFFADVDTRGMGSGIVRYGNTTFGGRSAFCVNWVNVGYYASRTDKLNSFQLLLVDRDDQGVGDFDIIFNYDQIQWETGSASGGTDGLGGSSARAGYSNGVDTSLELPGSAVNGAFLDSSPSGLANNSRSSTERGRYIFPVRNGVAPVGGSISGRVFGNEDGMAGAAGVVPLPGARVQACFAVMPPPPCDVTTTNALGQYIFTGLPGGGNYFVTAFPPSGSFLGPRTIGALFMPEGGAELIDQDITLIPSIPPPPNVTIETPFRAGDGTPAISSFTGATFRQVDSCPGGIGTWSLSQGGVVLASGDLTETAAGKYKGTIPPLPGRNGRASMKISINCPSGPDKQEVFDIYIDPSGNVYNSANGMPVEGATVTLYRSDSSAGPFTIVPNGDAIMSPSNRNNPDLTDENGFFRWDVVAGYYKVRAEKASCTNPDNPAQNFVETDVLPVPPIQTGLQLYLNCGGGTGPTPTRTATVPGAPTPTRTPTVPGGFAPGDVNKNGSVNSIDASIVLQYVAGFLGSINSTADVNEDGQVTSVDATLILQYVAGLIDNLPV
jgi:hypothetical protein